MIKDFPLLVFVLSLIVLWLSAEFGVFCRNRLRRLEEVERTDLATVLTATLTLLGLIIAFSFSMAVSGTISEKIRGGRGQRDRDREPPCRFATRRPNGKVRELLKSYLHQRVLFYNSHNPSQLEQIEKDTAAIEGELWSTVQAAATAQPNPVMALVTQGMNDVLNTRGYTQAAWWNRIPESGVGSDGRHRNFLQSVDRV